MSYRPPHARMRDIKRRAVTVRVEADAVAAAAAEAAPKAAPVSAPASVDEAMAVHAIEPEPVVVPEPEPELMEAANEAAPEEVIVAAPEPEEDEEDAPAEVSLDMKRSELNAIAEGLGVEDPNKLPNKQAVLDAISDAQDG